MVKVSLSVGVFPVKGGSCPVTFTFTTFLPSTKGTVSVEDEPSTGATSRLPEILVVLFRVASNEPGLISAPHSMTISMLV